MAAAWLERMSFRRADRIAVWTLCADLLESGYEVERVLPVVAEVYRQSGKGSIARVVDGFVPALQRNEIRGSIARVAPQAEAMVFEGFGRVAPASIFRSAARIAEVRDQLSTAMRTNLIGPFFLFLLAAGLLYGAGWGFVPALERMAPREVWSPESQCSPPARG